MDESEKIRPRLAVSAVSSDSFIARYDQGDRINRVDGLEKIGEYVTDEIKLRLHLGLSHDTVLKKDDQGRVLIPQPTDDPQDPLNWPAKKKALVMFMIAVSACTGDFIAASGASALIRQAHEWNITPETVNHATAGMTFMLGVGGLFTVWFSACFGRLPVLFWFQIIATATVIWCAAAQSFHSYMAARILNGFFAVCAAGGGLMFINDMFFFHHRARMVNIWSTAIIFSPFLGPQIMAAILETSSWRVGMWLNFAIIVAALLLTIVLGDETFYPRHLPPSQIAPRKSRLMRMIGVEQMRHRYTDNSFWESGSRLYQTLRKLPVFLTCLSYFFDFPWTIANNTTISVFVIPEYHLKYKNLAMLYIAPVLGALMGLLIGHFVFDLIGKIYARYHDGCIDPEARLIVLWAILPIKVLGFNLIGLAIEHHWSIFVLATGWGMHNFGTIVTTTALGAYLTDAYPEASGECAAWLNASRVTAGFIIGYLQIRWARNMGTQNVYGIESAIMSCAFLIIVFLQFYGARLRQRAGRLNFKTN